MGKEKRARQKAGTQARRAAQAEAAARTKKRRTIIKVGVVVLAVLGVFLGITLGGRDDADESAVTSPPPVGAEVVAEPDAEATADADDGGSEESDATGDESDATGDESDGADMDADDGTSDDGTTADSNAADDGTADDGTADDTADDATTDDATTDDATTDDAGIDDATTGGGPAYTPYAAGDFGVEPCAPAAGAGERVLDFDGPPMLCIDPAVAHTAVFDTSRGVVRVALDVAGTPGTVNSFVNLARFGYYDGTLVHRSAPSIGILQGGSPHTNSASDPGPGYTLWDEGTGFTYRPGQLVMARRGDPNSAGAQYFFTVTPDAGLLDGQGTYVVFGDVVEGLDVLTDMLASHVDIPDNPLGGAPDPPVVVNTLTIEVG